MLKKTRLKAMFETENCKNAMETNGISISFKNEKKFTKYILKCKQRRFNNVPSADLHVNSLKHTKQLFFWSHVDKNRSPCYIWTARVFLSLKTIFQLKKVYDHMAYTLNTLCIP